MSLIELDVRLDWDLNVLDLWLEQELLGVLRRQVVSLSGEIELSAPCPRLVAFIHRQLLFHRGVDERRLLLDALQLRIALALCDLLVHAFNK